MSGDLSLPVAWATGIIPGFGARRAPEVPWWHPKAHLALDFKGGRFMRSGLVLPEETLLSVTRSSGIWLPDAAGMFHPLGNNVLPRTDRGLYANGQLHIVNRSSGDFRLSPPANTGWNRSSSASFEDKPSIFAGAVACKLQGSGAGSEAFTTPNIAGLAGAYVFDVIIERGTNTLSTFGVGRNSPSFAWVALGQYNWTTNSLTAAAGTIASSRIQDLGVGPNGGSLRRLSIQLDISDGTAWGLYVYAAGTALNTHNAIAHYGALYSGVIHSDAAFLSPVGSSGTLFASDIRAVQGVRPSNSQPEPFPGWEAAGLDDGFAILCRTAMTRLSPSGSTGRIVSVAGATSQNEVAAYFSVGNAAKVFVRKDGVESADTSAEVAYALGVPIRVGITVTAAGAAICATGGGVQTDLSVDLPEPLNALCLGHVMNGHHLNGWIEALQICKPLAPQALLDWVNAE